MDYGGGRRVYTVSDSRLPVFCTYSSRPQEFMPVSGAVAVVPATTQSRMVTCVGDPFISNQRLMVLPPRIRRVYAGLDLSDDDEDGEEFSYPTPRPANQRVDHFIDEVCNSPQMEEIESETRKIRRDAQSVLQRLGESSKKKPVRLSSVYFPDLAYSSTSSSYTPRATASRYSPPRSSRNDRDATPTDYSDCYWRRPERPLRSCISSYVSNDPIAKVQSEINRKAIYSAECRKINDSARSAVRRRKEHVPDAEETKNNINFRAQYKSLRAAADVGLRKSNDYLMV